MNSAVSRVVDLEALVSSQDALIVTYQKVVQRLEADVAALKSVLAEQACDYNKCGPECNCGPCREKRNAFLANALDEGARR